MSKNSNYAKKLTNMLGKLPSEAVKATGRGVYLSVLQNTRQDSGQAAYNWKTSLNTTQQRRYSHIYGQGPVGYKGEKRSSRGMTDIVIDDRYKTFDDKLHFNKNVRFVLIYNPLEDPDHASNAELELAIGLSTGQDWMDSLAERAANANLRLSR
ncbi:MAG: hypothetical protein PVI43_00075 [Candidatus Bathyarchaeota archaeon]|jgi:hypothetical protein